MQILDLLAKRPSPFEVDGKAIIVAYAKNTFSTTLVTLNTKTPTSTQQYDYNQYYQGQGQDGYNYYDQSYYDQWSEYYQGDHPRTQTDGTNAAAAVAAAAIQQANAAKTTPASKSSSSTDAASEGQSATVAPDVSTFQYDESSGYYYDSNSGLYYDSSSQYFYNAESGQFLYWDNEKMQYLPAPDSASTPGKGKKEGKREKDRTAKKIAKDMEKWAKIVNNRKEMEKEIKRGTFNSLTKQEKESASADAGFALLEKQYTDVPDPKAAPHAPQQQQGQPSGPGGLVASYGGDSEESDDDGDDSESARFLDIKKLACLLCKRRFPSKEILLKHEQMSQLHKDNLKAEIAKGNIGNDNSKFEGDGGMSYRDRAKERREKFGFSVPEPRRPRGAMAPAAEPPIPYEQPTKEGIKNDNIGNRMLKKMGWSEGSGLGKSKQGIVDPIEASQRQMSAGLGARGSAYKIGPTDSYKDAVKKTMLARFKELQDS